MDLKVLYDKTYACWLGKNIGGTLGAPVEGKCEFMDIQWFPELGKNGPIPNDDLDLQLLNLHALEQFGAAVRATHIAREWTEHNYFPVDEYGYAKTAMRQGLYPPLSGIYNNMFNNCMGSPIRSEIWAAVCAGRPKMAAFFAWQDAVVDHAGDKGIYGEVFNAVIESLAYISDDLTFLIPEALKYIPESCRVYMAVNATFHWYQEGVSYLDIRGNILEKYGSYPHMFTDAPQNIAFELIVLLYGTDFADGMLKTVNFGYDTDCTVATYASIFGIMYGRKAIPVKWSDPIGDEIVLSKEVRGFRCPKSLTELTERTVRLYQILSFEDENNYNITAEDYTDYNVQQYTLPEGERREEAIWVTLKYNGGPGICENGEKVCNFRIRNYTAAPWILRLSAECPDGLIASGSKEIALKPGDETVYTITIRAGGKLNAAQLHCVLHADRILEDGIFMNYTIPFTLMRCAKWTVDGEETFIDGAMITCKAGKGKDGCHVAESTYATPVKRPTKFYIAATAPMELYIDGEKKLDAPACGCLRNSYSTLIPEKQQTEFVLEAGHHTVRVVLKEEGETTFSHCFTAKMLTEGVKRPLVAYPFLENIIG